MTNSGVHYQMEVCRQPGVGAVRRYWGANAVPGAIAYGSGCLVVGCFVDQARMLLARFRQRLDTDKIQYQTCYLCRHNISLPN